MALTDLPGWLQRCLGHATDDAGDDDHPAAMAAMDKRQAEMLAQLAAIEAQANVARIARPSPRGWNRAET